MGQDRSHCAVRTLCTPALPLVRRLRALLTKRQTEDVSGGLSRSRRAFGSDHSAAWAGFRRGPYQFKSPRSAPNRTRKTSAPARFDRAIPVQAPRVTGRAVGVASSLTSKETECLKWCKEGKTNWEIGEIISISEKTVEFHLSNTIRK